MRPRNPVCLSHELNPDTPCFAGTPQFTRTSSSRVKDGRSSNSERWSFHNHVGTHIDLPLHFDDNGKNLSDFAAADWIFHRPYLLNIEAKPSEILGVSESFKNIPADCDLLLLKTGFERYRREATYWNANPGLAPEIGFWLRRNLPSLRSVGFDFISLTSFSHRELGRDAHKAFLAPFQGLDPLCIVEDMKLSDLNYSPTWVLIAPLLVSRADGAPVSVYAFDSLSEHH